MAALLNSLSFAFTNSALPMYRVKYYDYIIKWCSGYNVICVYRWILTKFSFKEQIEEKTTSLLVQIDNRMRILVMLQIMRLNISYQLYVITKIPAIISRYLTAKFEQ